MDRFPSLGRGDRMSILPLCHNTALDVGRALLCGEEDSSRRAVSRALGLDPVFALWCVCEADRRFTRLPTLGELAHWFLTTGQARFAMPCDRQFPHVGGEHHSLLEKIEMSLRCARLAGQYANDACGESDGSYLLGLLGESGAILTDSSEGDAALAELHEVLPEWLLASLADVQSEGDLPAGSPPSHVRRARAEIVSDTARFDVEAHRAAERFQQQIPAADGLLTALCQTTSRLRGLEAEFQDTLEREKLASLKQLAYGASHEINNPLANISTRAQTLLRGEEDPERRRQLKSINSQAFRAHEMIADMMLFAHPPQLQPQPTDLRSLIESLIEGACDNARQQGTELSCEIGGDLPEIGVDPIQFAVALKTLMRNSLEALGSGGRVVVSARVADASRGSQAAIEICVADDGPGITADVRRHLFDPFFSGREAGRGLGFGLSKCWRIVELHGGTIVVDSQPGLGASLTVRLPLEPRTPAKPG